MSVGVIQCITRLAPIVENSSRWDSSGRSLPQTSSFSTLMTFPARADGRAAVAPGVTHVFTATNPIRLEICDE
jgi:hypothetical protein